MDELAPHGHRLAARLRFDGVRSDERRRLAGERAAGVDQIAPEHARLPPARVGLVDPEHEEDGEGRHDQAHRRERKGGPIEADVVVGELDEHQQCEHHQD